MERSLHIITWWPTILFPREEYSGSINPTPLTQRGKTDTTSWVGLNRHSQRMTLVFWALIPQDTVFQTLVKRTYHKPSGPVQHTFLHLPPPERNYHVKFIQRWVEQPHQTKPNQTKDSTNPTWIATLRHPLARTAALPAPLPAPCK